MSRIERLLRPTQPRMSWQALLPALGLVAALATGCSHTPPAQKVIFNTTMVPPTTAAVVRFDTCPFPAYPKESMAAEETGTVVMSFLLDTDGKVHDSRIDRTSGHPFLDEAARRAIAQCTFKPATKNWANVGGWAPVAYVWKLQ